MSLRGEGQPLVTHISIPFTVWLIGPRKYAEIITFSIGQKPRGQSVNVLLATAPQLASKYSRGRKKISSLLFKLIKALIKVVHSPRRRRRRQVVWSRVVVVVVVTWPAPAIIESIVVGTFRAMQRSITRAIYAALAETGPAIRSQTQTRLWACLCERIVRGVSTREMYLFESDNLYGHTGTQIAHR